MLTHPYFTSSRADQQLHELRNAAHHTRLVRTARNGHNRHHRRRWAGWSQFCWHRARNTRAPAAALSTTAASR